MNSTRIAFLGILTACIFAAFDFLATGFWIFPFPIYKTGLFLLVTVMLFAEKKMPDLAGFLALGWSLALLLSSRFFLRTFISDATLEQVDKGLFFSYAMIAFLLLFTAWSVIVSLRPGNKLIRLAAVAASLLFSVCLFLGLFDWAIFPLLLWLAFMFLGKSGNVPENGILLLVAFVYISSWIMGYYASLEIAGTSIDATGTDFILFSM